MIALITILLNVLVTGLIGLVTAIVIYARWHYGTLEKIKGLTGVVKPAFVGGSDIFVYKKVVHKQDEENVKKYGNIYGYYEGRYPHIYVADPELIRLIFIKDFDYFHNKRIIDFGHELINDMLDILPYEKWKVVRNYISPTLTTGKIRHMSQSMTETIVEWMETVKMKQKNNEKLYPKRIYTALTTDVIARCGFGVKLNSLHDPDNYFVQQMRKMTQEGYDPNYMLTVSHIFQFLTRLAPIFPTESLDFLNGVLKNTMKSRTENNVKINDLVDTLNEMIQKLETEEYKKLQITETTIMCQALIFFLAGFETTANTLTFLTYSLAKNPDVQKQLLAELDAYLARHEGRIEHETISELTYMSACIQETLRMYPPLIRIERVCNKDWQHGSLHIPKDITVQVPITSIHYNSEYYPDPYTFKPERFLPENKEKLNPYAFLSFGQGNHNCIGMRFAKEEIHLTMANVLKHFSFEATAETKIEFDPGRTFLISAKPFTVEAIKRQKHV